MGYDIESRDPKTGHLHFLEVKGRIEGAQTVTITKNEIFTAFNKPEEWILALVKVPAEAEIPADVSAEMIREQRAAYRATPGCVVRYLRQPFSREPDFGVTSVNYDLKELWARGSEPS